MKKLKLKLTIEGAQKYMFDLLNKEDMGDRIYELAQDIFQGCINVVENNSVIEGVEEYLDTGQAWYDEIQEEFYQAVYDKMTDFLTAKN